MVLREADITTVWVGTVQSECSAEISSLVEQWMYIMSIMSIMIIFAAVDIIFLYFIYLTARFIVTFITVSRLLLLLFVPLKLNYSTYIHFHRFRFRLHEKSSVNTKKTLLDILFWKSKYIFIIIHSSHSSSELFSEYDGQQLENRNVL